MRCATKKGLPLSRTQGRPIIGVLHDYPSHLRKLIFDLRNNNPGWGAISILVELKVVHGYAEESLPSADAVYRYLKSCNLIAAKVPKNPLPQFESPKVKDFHDLWEMDAQGAEHVKGIGFIAMINIKDAKSKAYVCSFPVHVKSTKGKPKTVHYLWALRLAFEEFGLPKTIQVDRDSVFIDNIL